MERKTQSKTDEDSSNDTNPDLTKGKKTMLKDKQSKKGKNNNSLPDQNIDLDKPTRSNCRISYKPIIQTRGMKQRDQLNIDLQVQNECNDTNFNEINYLNQIDALTQHEISDGEKVLQAEDVEVDHDGVELSI